MAFVSLTGGGAKRGRAKGSGHPAILTVKSRKGAVSQHGTGAYADRHLFRIAETLAVESKLKRGDKVEVLFDAETMMAMICKTERGYCLSNTAGGFDLCFNFPHIEGSGFPYYEIQTGMDEVVVENCDIVFKVPEPQKMRSLSVNQQGQQNSKTPAEIPHEGSKNKSKES